MYPSGPYRGRFKQEGHWFEMAELTLRFGGGQVTGQGQDWVGIFTIAGEVSETGEIGFIKQYLGRHRVFYLGQYDGEGTIHGRWWITEELTDEFVLSPVIARPAIDAPIDSL